MPRYVRRHWLQARDAIITNMCPTLYGKHGAAICIPYDSVENWASCTPTPMRSPATLQIMHAVSDFRTQTRLGVLPHLLGKRATHPKTSLEMSTEKNKIFTWGLYLDGNSTCPYFMDQITMRGPLQEFPILGSSNLGQLPYVLRKTRWSP